MDPKKMGIAIAVGAPKGPSGEGPMSGDEADKHGMSAMQAFASAMKSGDVSGMWAAFQAADAVCEESEGGDEGGEEAPPDDDAEAVPGDNS